MKMAKLRLWKKSAIIGFLLGILVLLYVAQVYHEIEAECKLVGCGIGVRADQYILAMTLTPFMLIVLAPFYFIGNVMPESRLADLSFEVIKFTFMYSYPVAYALYGAFIGWVIERNKRIRNRK